MKRICNRCKKKYVVGKKVVKIFCGNCLKEIRGEMYLANLSKGRSYEKLRMV